MATPVPSVLVHPPTVEVTVYVPAVFTEIDGVVASFDHSNPSPVAESTDVPQLFETDTIGVVGIASGAATAEATLLVQPFAVCVTV